MASEVNIGVTIDVQKIEGLSELGREIRSIAEEAQEIADVTGGGSGSGGAAIDIDQADLNKFKESVSTFKEVVNQLAQVQMDDAGKKIDDHIESAIEEGAKEIQRRIEAAFQDGSSNARDALGDASRKIAQEAKEGLRKGSRSVASAASGGGSGGNAPTSLSTGGGSGGGDGDGASFMDQIRQEGVKATEQVDKLERELKTAVQTFQEFRFDKVDTAALKKIRRRVRGTVADARRTLGRLESISNEAMESFGENSTQFKVVQVAIGKLRSELKEMIGDAEGVEETINNTVNDFKKLGQASDDVRNIENQVEKLIDAQSKLENETAETVSEQKVMGNIARRVSKEYDNLADEILEAEQQLEKIQEQAGADTAAATTASNKLQQLQKIKQQLGQQVGTSGARQARARHVEAERNVKRLDKSAAKLTATLRRVKDGMTGAKQAIQQGGDATLNAAEDIRYFGKQASDARRRVQRNIQDLEEMRQKNDGLAESEERLLKKLKQLDGQFSKVSASQKRMEQDLDRVTKAQKRAGKGFQAYNKDLQDSIVNNFKFINAIGIVTSAIFGLQQAFFEFLRESEAFGRALTVLRSETKNLAGTFDLMKGAARDAAQEFGVRIDKVSEVLFQLGSAGLSAEKSVRGLDQVLKLLISTEGSAREVTKSVAGLYNVFGDQISAAGNQAKIFDTITNTLSATFRDHQVELSEMTEGLKFVAATGKTAGFTFKEMSGQLAVLNDNLIKSGQAGRVLQRVLSQFAAKQDKFAQALDITIQPQKPLSEQFQRALEEAQKELEGGISTQQLQQQFELFGLRGAKGFVTLAQNADDLKEVMEELRNSTGGVTDQLAEIQTNTLFRQFLQAKEAVLGLVREGLEPAKAVLSVFVSLLVAFSEILDATGLDHFVTLLSVLGGSAIILVQSFVAVTNLLTVFINKVRESVGNMFSFITSNQAVGRAAYEASNGIRVQKNQMKKLTVASQQASSAQRQTASSAAKSGTFFATLGGKIAAAVLILTTLVSLYQSFQTTSQDLNDSIRQTSVDIKNINQEIDDTEKFIGTLQDIEEDMGKVGVTTEQLASRIRGAFNESTLAISNAASVLTQTNEELVDDFGSTVDRLEEEAERIKKLKMDERLDKAREQAKKFAEQTVRSFNNLDNVSFRVFDDSSAVVQQKFNSFRKMNEELSRLLELRREFGSDFSISHKQLEQGIPNIDQSTAFSIFVRGDIQGAIDNVRDKLGSFRESVSPFIEDYRSAILEVDSKFSNLSREFREKQKKRIESELAGTIQEGLLSTMDIDEDEAKRRAQKTVELINRMIDEQIYGEIIVPDEEIIKIRREIGGLFKEIQSIFDVPIRGGRFDQIKNELEEVRDRAKNVKEDFDEVMQTIRAGDALNLDFSGELDINQVKRTLSKSVESAIKGGEESMDNLVQFFENRLEGVDIKTEEDLRKAFSEAVNQVDIMNDGVIDSRLEMARLIEFTRGFVNAQGEGVEKQLALARSYESSTVKNTLKERADLMEQFVEASVEATRQNTSLNSLVQRRLEIERKFQELEARELGDFTSDELLKDMDRIFANITTGIDRVNKKAQQTSGSVKGIGDKAPFKEFTEFGDNIERQLKQLEGVFNAAQLSAEANRKAKQYILEIAKLNNKLQKARLQTSQLEKNTVNTSTAASEKANAVEQSVFHLRQELQLSDKITNSRRTSLKALNAIEDKQQDILKARQEFNQQVQETTNTAFENLEIADKILNSDSEHAGVKEQITNQIRIARNATSEIRTIMERIDDLSSADESTKRRIVNLENRRLSAIQEAFDLLQDLKEKESEVNEIMDERLGTLQEIRDIRKDQTDEATSAAKELLENQFDQNSIRTAFQLAREAGLDVRTVLANTDKVMEQFISRLKTGEANVGALSGRLRKVASVANQSGSRVERLNNQLERTAKQRISSGFDAFNKALDAGNIEKAKQQLQSVEQSVSFLQDNDPERLRTLQKILNAQGRLANAEQQSIKQQLDLIYGGEIENIAELEADLQRLARQSKRRMSQVLGDIPKAAQEAAKQLNEEMKGSKITLFRSDEGIRVIRNMTKSLDNVSKGLDQLHKDITGEAKKKGLLREQQVEKKRTGGKIPGFGGGDIVPAMLEPGEFVMPKEAVKKFGPGIFESMRRGSLPGFQDGGLVFPGSQDDVDQMIQAAMLAEAQGKSAAQSVLGTSKNTAFDIQGLLVEAILKANSSAQSSVGRLLGDRGKTRNKGIADTAKKVAERINKTGGKSPAEIAKLEASMRAAGSVTDTAKSVAGDMDKRKDLFFAQGRANVRAFEVISEAKSKAEWIEFLAYKAYLLEKNPGLKVNFQEGGLVDPGLSFQNEEGGIRDTNFQKDVARWLPLIRKIRKDILDTHPNAALIPDSAVLAAIARESQGDPSLLQIGHEGMNDFGRGLLQIQENASGSKSVSSFIPKSAGGSAATAKQAAKNSIKRTLKFWSENISEVSGVVPPSFFGMTHQGPGWARMYQRQVVNGDMSEKQFFNSLDNLSDRKQTQLQHSLTEFQQFEKIYRKAIEKSNAKDEIISKLQEGEFVIPKEVAGQLSPGFLEAMLKAGKTGGSVAKGAIETFHSGGFVGGRAKFQKGGRVRSFDTTVGSRDTERKIVRSIESLKKVLLGQFQENNAISLGKEQLAKVPFVDTLINKFKSAIDQFDGILLDFFSNTFVPEFAKANAEAFEEFKDQMDDIEAQFERAVGDASDQLARNQTGFFDFLNRLQDAEEQRIQQAIDAQEQYQEKIKETEEVLVEQATSIVNSFAESDFVGSAFSQAGKGVFGSFNNNIAKAAQNVGLLSGALENEGKESLDRIEETAKLFGNILKSSGSLLSQGVSKFVNLLIGKAGQIVSLAFSTKEVGAFRKFLSDFAENADKKIDEFLDNFDKIIDALVENLPIIIEKLAERLPEILQSILGGITEVLPAIVNSLAKNLPNIIQSITNLVIDLFLAILDQLPQIVSALVEGAGKLVGTVLKRLPEIVIELVKTVFETIFQAFFKSGAAGGILATITAAFIALKLAGVQLQSSSAQQQSAGVQLQVAAQQHQIAATQLQGAATSLAASGGAGGGTGAGAGVAQGFEQATSTTKNAAKTTKQASKGMSKALKMAGGVLAAGITLATSISSLVKGLKSGSKKQRNRGIGGLVGTIAGGTVGFLVGGPAGALTGAALGGSGGQILGGLFQQGGVVGGKSGQAVPIIAHEGEGVLTKEATKALGGAKGVKKLNENLPKFQSGGVVGGIAKGLNPVPIGVKPNGGNSNIVQTNNSVEVNVDGGSTGDPEDDRRLARNIAKEVDNELAKNARDRNSKFAEEIS